jgi:hypothetical protein
MRLALYATVADLVAPNLVALQDETLTALPTVLVCPLKPGIALTSLRVEVPWGDQVLIACTDLARPIRRASLRLMGSLDPTLSRAIMERFSIFCPDRVKPGSRD